MGKSKLLWLLICIALLFSLLPGNAVQASASAPSYPTLITASDFQGGSGAYSNFTELLQVSGCTAPDGILLGGDYGDETAVDSGASAEQLMEAIRDSYPAYPRERVLIARGNHDQSSEALDQTGLYLFEEYAVYVLSYEDYPDGQYWRDGAEATVRSAADDLYAALEPLAAAGDSRPVFILSHVPLHHSRRSSYGDTLYGKYLFDVLNQLGRSLDLIYLFGHNHSSDYDDYLGGSVNFLAPGETIRIAMPHNFYRGEAGYTNERLYFTYANCGYVGYSRNSVNEFSTNVLTIGLWEIRPTSIRLLRYEKDGLYCTHRIRRQRPSSLEPYVKLDTATDYASGTVSTVSADVGNLEAPAYSWSTADSAIAEVSGSGTQAQLLCRSPGTTDLSLTVTDALGRSATDSISVTVSSAMSQEAAAELHYNCRSVGGKTLYFFDIEPGMSFSLGAEAKGLGGSTLGYSWESSDPSVAAVDNGMVSFRGAGTAEIRFTAEGDQTSCSSAVRMMVSPEPKPTFQIREEDGALYGYAWGSALSGWHSRLMPNGDTECYYFDPASGCAVDGICTIEGREYTFTDHILTLGAFAEDDAGRFYYWAGEQLRNKWFHIGEDKYFALSSGYLATGIQWILTPLGDAYGGFVFREDGRLLKDLRGLYHLGADTYLVDQGALVQEAGLVYLDGFYYFFPASSKAVKNTGYWVYKTNGILPEGQYYFDREGKMLDAPEIYHTITWIVEGVSTTQTYRSGDLPDYGAVPEKAPTAQWEYEFTGWSPACSIAIADATYEAVFSQIPHCWHTDRTEPGCSTQGLEIISCSSCGYLLSETELSPLGHSYEEILRRPTCTRGGSTLHQCSRCGYGYRTDFRPPTGHVNLYSIEIKPTCTDNGSVTILCRCGTLINLRQTKALGHSYVYEDRGADHSLRCSRGCGLEQAEPHDFSAGGCPCGARPTLSAALQTSRSGGLPRIPLRSLRRKLLWDEILCCIKE
ncbi:MAG: metallophosphoesterase [Oscillospiraceae bacterium]|nr:metallophosphoesterase [Oscillospiraceae bacterium]